MTNDNGAAVAETRAPVEELGNSAARIEGVQ